MASTIIVFALLGIGSGAIYALAAFGLIVIHRSSGVLNFAIGATGMAGTFAYWELRDHYHLVPTGVALVAGTAVSALLGLLTYLLMSRMKRGSNLMRVVLTLTVLVELQGLASLHYSSTVSYTSAPIFPTFSVRILGVGIGVDRFILIGLAVVLTAVVWLAYRYTRFGLATSAVAENPEALSTLGWSARSVATVNWAAGSAMSGLAGILLAPILGVTVGMATSLLLPALASAVLGGLNSFPLTLLGGAFIGIIQSEILRFAPSGGEASSLGDAVPFVAIIVYIAARGRALPLRSYIAERLPRVTSGEIRPVKVAAYTLLAAGVIYFVLPQTWVIASVTTMTVALVLLSLVLLTGFAGQISLAQWTIAGTGALIASQLVVHGVSYVPAIIIGTLSGIPIGGLLGTAALRARGLSLAIATLAFNVCIVSIVLNSQRLTGGVYGLSIGFIHLFGLDIDPVSFPQRYAIFVLLVLLAVGLGLANMRRGRAGRRLLALRANERAAAALGIDVKSSKIIAFAISAMIAALGGILTIFLFPLATFTAFDTITSIEQVSNAALGGVGFVTGPVVGAQGTSGGITSTIVNLIPGVNDNTLAVLLGLLTLWVIVQVPDGAVPLQSHLNAKNVRALRRLVHWPDNWVPEHRSKDEEQAVAHARTREISPVRVKPAALEASGLMVAFGAVRAVNEVSFRLGGGEVLGVIGPNGAGKTTLIDALTGFVSIRSGRVTLDGADVSKMSVRRRARLGISRSFQSLELFEDLTVRENLLAACDSHRWSPWVTDFVHPGRPELSDGAIQAIRSFGLVDTLNQYPQELPLAERKLVAFARAAAARPRVLLLDEPAAGLDDKQRTFLRAVIRELADTWGMAVLLIEHDVDLVCSVSDRVLAMDFGQVIVLDTPATVRAHPKVVESYLGVLPGTDEEVVER